MDILYTCHIGILECSSSFTTFGGISHDLRANPHVWGLWHPCGCFGWWFDLEMHLPFLVENLCLTWGIDHSLETTFDDSLSTLWGGHPLLRSFSTFSWGHSTWKRGTLEHCLLSRLLHLVLRPPHHTFFGMCARRESQPHSLWDVPLAWGFYLHVASFDYVLTWSPSLRGWQLLFVSLLG